jgi:hypothetical protein
MSNPDARQVLSAARESLARPFDFDQFLARLGPKDRISAGRRVDALEAEPGAAPGADPARLWKRLACTLMKLCAHAAKLVGRQTVQFYVADGKYRMQVFALEDLQDGILTVYCPDVLDEAVGAGLLVHTPGADPAGGEPGAYAVAASGEPIGIVSLSGSSRNPAPHFKDMTGWNRKAIRITLPPSPSDGQVQAAELLCAIAAQRFAAPPPSSASHDAPSPPPAARGLS